MEMNFHFIVCQSTKIINNKTSKDNVEEKHFLNIKLHEKALQVKITLF